MQAISKSFLQSIYKAHLEKLRNSPSVNSPQVSLIKKHRDFFLGGRAVGSGSISFIVIIIIIMHSANIEVEIHGLFRMHETITG